MKVLIQIYIYNFLFVKVFFFSREFMIPERLKQLCKTPLGLSHTPLCKTPEIDRFCP